MPQGYPSPYGNIREGSYFADLGYDSGINPALALPGKLTPEQLYGENFNFLSSKAKDIAGGGLDPVLAELLGIQKNTINKQAGEARRATDERLSSSGFRGSGANLMSDIYREQSDATQAASANIGAMGLQNKQFYSNLLNSMNQQQGGANLANAQYQTMSIQDILGLLSNNANTKRAQQAEEGTDWGGLAGNIVTGGATVGAAFIM